MHLKIQKKIVLDNIFPIYLMLIGMVLIQVSAPFDLSIFMSMGVWLIVASSILAFIIPFLCNKRYDSCVLLVMALVGLIILSVSFSFSFSYSSIVDAICFLEIPLFISAYNRVDTDKVKKAIYIFFTFLSVFYVIISLTSLAYIYSTKYGDVVFYALTLSYNNPNETAMYIFVCVIVLVSLLNETKNLIAKILLYIDIAANLYLIWLTESRTCVVIAVLFIIGAFVFRNKNMPFWFRNLAFIIHFFFLIISLLFYSVLGSISFMGESFDTGRSEIFNSLINELDIVKFLFGNFSIGFENLHNGFICIFGTVGIFGAIIFFILISRKIKYVQYGVINEGFNRIALLGLLCIVLVTSTEAAFFSAGSVFAASFVSIYLLSISSKREDSDESFTD